MAHQPVGDSVEVAAAGTSATSAAQSQRTNSLRVVAVTNAACVAIGEAAELSVKENRVVMMSEFNLNS